MSVGNAVFFDANANGKFDPELGEGVGDVTVELWKITNDPEMPEVLVGAQQTQLTGFYLFQGLDAGTYYLRIPETEFLDPKPLAGAISMPGYQNSGDDDAGEDGLDGFGVPSLTGVNTMPFNVAPGFGPTALTGETGFQSSNDDAEDTNVDLTMDFGFYRPVGLGNLVFADVIANGHADPGEGISGVVVQLFKSTDDPAVDAPMYDVLTASDGTLYFGGLVPGSYKLHVPPSQFGAGGPLEGATSLTGVGTAGVDDDDDGIDSAAPDQTGITSRAVTLAVGSSPTGATTETGISSGDDNDSDSDFDLTIDFGFQFPANKMSIGNVVFIDSDNTGTFSDGEGAPGVTLKLFLAGQNPATDTPVATAVTKSDGSYLINNLDPGTYFIHIAKEEFAPNKPLFSALSISGSALGDDDAGEDGIDTLYPEMTGVSSANFTLVLNGAPTDATVETGYAADSDNFRDANVDLTHDFGFQIRARNPVAVGNLVFNDANHNGKFDEGEAGIGGVVLQLFHEGEDPLAVAPVASLQTEPDGGYMFSGLTPGRYFVFVPPSQFGAGQPLLNLLSSSGNGSDNGVDDDNNEDGIDSETPATTGIRSIVFELSEDLETPETGFSPNMDIADDNNGDLTIDFGFAQDCPVVIVQPATLPAATRDQSYSAVFTLTGGSGNIIWTVNSGSLPNGLSLAGDGTLSGIPGATGSYTFTVQAETPEHCIASQFYTLTVQAPFNMGAGNCVFFDINGNGHFDAGEGVENVTVQLFHSGDDPATAPVVDSVTTNASGLYAFNNLQAGSYFIHIPASQFQLGGALNNAVSIPGAGSDNGVDDNFDENGVDSPNPSSTGISSIVFTLTENTEPVDAGTETGTGAANDNAHDANFDATIDLGFIPSPAVSVGLGNLVFRDANNSGHFEEGEGVDGVTVQLFRNTDNPLVALPTRSTTTASGGRYLFLGLVPGSYKVFVPPAMFASGAPLYGMVSMTGAGADAAGDDDADENGIDDASPATHGIVSTVAVLSIGGEPQNSDVETGASNTVDDGYDANADLTVDLGFVRDCHAMTLLPGALPDAVLGVGYSAQFQTTGGVVPYSYTLASGALPNGLTLHANGLLDGSPAQYGTFQFGVQATDDYSCFVINNYTLVVAPPPLAVGNFIFFDRDGDGVASASEGVDGVTVQVFTNTQTPGVDAPVGFAVTNGGGFWLVDNLAPGQYVVHVPKEMFGPGAPLWKMVSVSGVVSTGDDDAGEKGGDAIDPAQTGVTSVTFSLQPGLCPAGAFETGLAGSSDDARDNNIDLTRDLGFVDATSLPAWFAQWQLLHNLSGGATGNSDHDALSDLLEYAFGTDPSNGGAGANASFVVTRNPTGTSMTVQIRRRHGGQNDLSYVLQVLANLTQAPNGWTASSVTPVITNNGDGTETLTFSNVDLDPVFSGSRYGFVRVLVLLDADHNGTPDASDASQVLGWQLRPLAVQHQTYAVPFVAPAVFTGTVDSAGGSGIDVTTAAGAVNLSSLFSPGFEYYVEVIGGDNEGHRFDVDESLTAAGVIAITPGSSRSTKASLPADLAGDLVALRPYWRVADLFPVTDYHATTSANTADQIVLWNAATASYTTLWLFNQVSGKKWLRVGDATLTNQNNLVINPSDGLFSRPRFSTINSAANGQVRTWKFAAPLIAGLNFLGNPYPVDQSPLQRLMTVANGFVGSVNANNADKFNFWNGDASTATTYSVYYLLKTASFERWVRVGDSTLTDRAAEKLFPAGTSVFVNSKLGLPGWVFPVPWTP